MQRKRIDWHIHTQLTETNFTHERVNHVLNRYKQEIHDPYCQCTALVSSWDQS